VIEQPRLSEGGQMFANRLQKTSRQLGKWAKREGIDCYRVYDADMPEYAMAIDLYHDWVHVQEYAAPSRSIRKRPRRACSMPWRRSAGAEHRQEPRGGQAPRAPERHQAVRASGAGQVQEVSEGGVKLLVNLTDYLDTGLFLDHRPMRMRIQKEAAGKRFLNLFCYTATASVHAAKGGAQHHQRRPVEDLPGLGAAQPVAERLLRQEPPGAGRCDGVAGKQPRRVRPDLHRPADLLQLQAHGRHLRRAA
jgi:23S rRNA (guanine2445-N2)-methyltransferase / 23S rRNA (guanine2069-N7)-methyltransferase